MDDQEINRDILGVILEDTYDVDYACDGVEAMEKIEANPSLSLVMLDLFMPNMDGFEVLRRMKADDVYKEIPVIVLTSEKSAELKALQMGASDFITKPFDVHEVVLTRAARIMELCEGRKLISSAEYDHLTNLYSRNFFYEYAARLFAGEADKKRDAAVVSIDQFSSISALQGRDYTDNILRIIGREILSFLPGKDGLAGRIDEDRFAIYCAQQDDYTPLYESLEQTLSSYFPGFNVRLRIGVKPWGSDNDITSMFDHAKAASDMASGGSGSHVVVYDDEIAKKEMLNHRLLSEQKKALEERQFEIFYQPKYNVQCDPPMLVSAEALVRWRHPELGMISPGIFIPLFEEKGRIQIIDHFAWSEAAEHIAHWKKKYGMTVPVSVNVSRMDIFESGLTERLSGLVNDNGLDYKDLKLEITESAYTENAVSLIEIVSGLRKLGFQIEMDDFGSGYSSLNMISAMPIDVIKMDMKFVRNIEKSETDRKLVKLILDIAKVLSFPVVAEGVETEGQLAFLREAGCDIVQGYYFSKPLPAHEFEALIEKEKSIKR